jgi:hypothetical protein
LRLLRRRDRVDIRGIRRIGQICAQTARLIDQPLDQVMRALEPVGLNHRDQRIEPLLGLFGVQIGVACGMMDDVVQCGHESTSDQRCVNCPLSERMNPGRTPKAKNDAATASYPPVTLMCLKMTGLA